MNKNEIEREILVFLKQEIRFLKKSQILVYENGSISLGGSTLSIIEDGVSHDLDMPVESWMGIMHFLSEKVQQIQTISFQEDIWNSVKFILDSEGNFKSTYWYDEERIKSDALRPAKDFPHAMANHLVNHYLFATVKFKRKFERIIWTLWIKDGLPYFELHSINKKNQKLSIELLEYYEDSSKKALLEHYKVTNNGILKDVWNPWNKIVISIPLNGYLNENEDIAYYLDDVKLEKDFFLRGY